MCDTLVALDEATADGSVILAKNSDREPNEAHLLVWYPHQEHAPDAQVQCTYIAIPQVRETYEVLLCKPFWLWGCEMGANEKGVAIGNEAVFTKEPYAATGLLGMDLMRLALERAASAEKALEVITELIAEYGQGGACGYRNKGLRYHNSFLIADPSTAWVLETAGRYWVAERVRDVRSISNRLSIGETHDLSSPGVIEHARERGWLKRGQDFHFARCYSDWFYTTFSKSQARQTRSTAMLQQQRGRITVATMMAALRDHGAITEEAFDPAHSSMASICMHAGNNLTRASQSTGALVAHLAPTLQTYWVTGTSATCTSVFKPLYLEGLPLPEHGPAAEGSYNDETLWWHHEVLHRATLRDYARYHALYRQPRDMLEAEFICEAQQLASPDHSLQERAAFSQRCFDRAIAATDDWIKRLATVAPTRRPPWSYRRFWNKQGRLAGWATRW